MEPGHMAGLLNTVPKIFHMYVFRLIKTCRPEVKHHYITLHHFVDISLDKKEYEEKHHYTFITDSPSWSVLTRRNSWSLLPSCPFS